MHPIMHFLSRTLRCKNYAMQSLVEGSGAETTLPIGEVRRLLPKESAGSPWAYKKRDTIPNKENENGTRKTTTAIQGTCNTEHIK